MSTLQNLDQVEQVLKNEKIEYRRDANLIVSTKRHTTGEGFKLEIELTFEQIESEVTASILGLGEDLIGVSPEKSIAEFKIREVFMH